MNTDMTPEQALATYRAWEQKRREALAEVERLRRVAFGYTQMIDGLRAIYPEVGDAQERESVVKVRERLASSTGTTVLFGEARPAEDVIAEQTTSEAALAILQEKPGQWFTPRAILQELQQRGWRAGGSHPDNAVRKALRAEAEAGRVAKGKVDGRTTAYRLAVPMNASGPAEAGPEDATVPTDGAGGDSDAFPAPHDDGRPVWSPADHHRREGASVA